MVLQPTNTGVVTSLPGGYQPDVAVSPDGSKLYLGYSDKRNPEEGKLEVIDTRSGTVLKEVPNRYRWLTPHYLYSRNMVISKDGAWLYVFKMGGSSEYPEDHLEVFDTRTNTFLPSEIELPECVSATMVPSTEGVYIICGGTQDVHFVTIDNDTKAVRSSTLILDIASNPNEGSNNILPGHKYAHYPATGFVNPEARTFTAITTDGIFSRADVVSGKFIDRGTIDRTPHEPSLEPGVPVSEGWLQDHWVRNQVPVLSPDDKKIYLGLGSAKLLQRGSQLLERIIVLDASDLGLMSTLNPHRTFWSFAIGSRGNRMFVVDPNHAVIIVLDANSGRELGTISGVGTTPVYVVVAP